MRRIVFLPTIAIACIAAFGATLASSEGAAAQEYPSQLIKVVIPNPPGGPGDVIARAFTDRASQKLPKGFVFEYRAGASTTTGTNAVVKADPDGYTILGLPSAGLAVTLLRKKLPYNLETDLRPIVGIGSVPLVLVARAGLKIKTIEEFKAAAQKGTLLFGSGGVGTVGHLTALSLLNELGATATHVPFRGNPEVMQAILGGSVDFFFGSIADAVAYAELADVVLLGMTADRRAATLKAVPTMTELGLAKIDSKLWYAFMAPSQTPTDRVKRLHDAIAAVASDPDLQKQVGALGFNVEIRDPAQLAAMMKAEAARWKVVIETNKIAVSE